MESKQQSEFDRAESSLRTTLALFQPVLDKRAEVGELGNRIVQLKTDIKKLEEELAAVVDNIGISEAELEKLQADHDVKKAEWNEKTKSGDKSFFSFAAFTSWFGAENRESLENTSKRAHENAALLDQCLDIGRLTDLISHKTDIKLVPLQKKLDETNSILNAADGELKALNEQLQALHKEWEATWENTVKSDRVPGYQKGFSDGISQGEKNQMAKLAPLAKAGAYVRRRKLEWVKDGKPDEKLVDLGDQASHYGMVVADAALYQSFCSTKRTDIPTFVLLYGVEPCWVWERRCVTQLVQILDWRAAMRNFHPGTRYETTSFHPLFNQILKELKGEDSQTVVRIEQYFVQQTSKFQTLKGLYELGLIAHKVYLKNR